MHNIYLISLQYTSSASSQANQNLVNPGTKTKFMEIAMPASKLEVRVGYFGLCVKNKDDFGYCDSHLVSLTDHFEPAEDPLHIV